MVAWVTHPFHTCFTAPSCVSLSLFSLCSLSVLCVCVLLSPFDVTLTITPPSLCCGSQKGSPTPSTTMTTTSLAAPQARTDKRRCGVHPLWLDGLQRVHGEKACRRRACVAHRLVRLRVVLGHALNRHALPLSALRLLTVAMLLSSFARRSALVPQSLRPPFDEVLLFAVEEGRKGTAEGMDREKEEKGKKKESMGAVRIELTTLRL